MDNGHSLCTTYLNLVRAFTTILHAGVLISLLNNANLWISHWIPKWRTDRIHVLKDVGVSSECKNATSGILQGLVLGTTLSASISWAFSLVIQVCAYLRLRSANWVQLLAHFLTHSYFSNSFTMQTICALTMVLGYSVRKCVVLMDKQHFSMPSI